MIFFPLKNLYTSCIPMKLFILNIIGGGGSGSCSRTRERYTFFPCLIITCVLLMISRALLAGDSGVTLFSILIEVG